VIEMAAGTRLLVLPPAVSSLFKRPIAEGR
jgi:hypothetical protein